MTQRVVTDEDRLTLAERCPKCEQPAGNWCKANPTRLSRWLHQDRIAVARFRRERQFSSAHAFQRAAMSNPETIMP